MSPKVEFRAVGDMYSAFTRDQAPGAWPNGSVVVKLNSAPDDNTPDNTRGLIVGSFDVREAGLPARFGYFIEWETRPGIPVFAADTNTDGSPRLRLEVLQ